MNTPQLTRIYRWLVGVSAGTWLVQTVLPYVEQIFWHQDMNDLLSYHGSWAIFPLSEFLWMALTLFGVWARGSMWFFHPYARVSMLATVLAGFPLGLLGGVGVWSPIGSTVGYLGCLSDGALLALAYFGPMRRPFLFAIAKMKAEENETHD